MKIGFVPIDNRPVCYTLPKNIAEIDETVEFFIPPRKYLGDLTKYADTEKIFQWLENLPELDSLVISLDTVAYGGLISSRRSNDSFEVIKQRIFKLKEILEKKHAKIYAFSSIMRISNNNINEEEKIYWSDWGKKIFEYSFNRHKSGDKNLQTDIPQEILEDYLTTRDRNFEINKIYLDWLKDGIFDTLVFSKDDCAEYGLNVEEAEKLKALGGFVKTGADEIPLTLLARALDKKLKVAVEFTAPDEVDLISNYEDISIKNSVIGQLELGGCEVVDKNNADIILVVNNFENHQGEIVMKRPTKPFEGEFLLPDTNFIVADVRFANGADNNFVKKLMSKNYNENFFGYSAWNTSANTLGSLICGAKFKFFAKKYSDKAFKKLQATRLLDDWAYQANVRQNLTKPDENKTKDLMKDFEIKTWEFLGTEFSTNYKFPWNRLFEVEVELN